MTNNNYTIYDNARISTGRTSASWKVELEEEEKNIFIKKKIVEEISSETNAEEALVALLLAYINYVRITVHPNCSECPRKIVDEKIIESTIILLNSTYPIEYIIEWVRDAKWTEIERVYKARNPAEELGEII